MLAMSVPSPPRFVPITRAFPFCVKADRSSAAGTLLMTCEDTIAVSTGDEKRIINTLECLPVHDKHDGRKNSERYQEMDDP